MDPVRSPAGSSRSSSSSSSGSSSDLSSSTSSSSSGATEAGQGSAGPHRQVIKVSDGIPGSGAAKGLPLDPPYRIPARMIKVACKLDHSERSPVPLVRGEAKEICDKLARGAGMVKKVIVF
ncbi:MAG: hypothetical protein FJ333_07965 [Sphingomonadales bacterium]|nr:hypothetical protein [Sphingomonadales bacterium]